MKKIRCASCYSTVENAHQPICPHYKAVIVRPAYVGCADKLLSHFEKLSAGHYQQDVVNAAQLLIEHARKHNDLKGRA